jgi:hypothetical protein
MHVMDSLPKCSRTTSMCAAVILIVCCNEWVRGANQYLPPLVVSQDTDRAGPPFDVDQYLKGPVYKDFRWEVQTSLPILTMHQRRLLMVGAYIPHGRIKEVSFGRDLHFVLKVATADNQWVPACSYTHLPVPQGLRKSYQIQYLSGVYLRPGRYTVALVAYDAKLKQANVWRKNVTIAPLKNDPLSGIDRNLPDVEFLPKAPPGGLDSFYHRSNYGFKMDKNLAKGREWLPVNNSRCTCIDLLVDLNYLSDIPDMPIHALQKASVLSHLGLRNGRVRITVLDYSQMKTFFYLKDAEDFDWESASGIVAKQNTNPYTADVGTLPQKKSDNSPNGIYLHNVLQKILDDQACMPGVESPEKIVIILFGPVHFSYHLTRNDWRGDISAFIKYVNHPLVLNDPLAFRKWLATFIAELEK